MKRFASAMLAGVAVAGGAVVNGQVLTTIDFTGLTNGDFTPAGTTVQVGDFNVGVTGLFDNPGVSFGPQGVDFANGIDPTDHVAMTYTGANLPATDFGVMSLSVNTGKFNPTAEGFLARNSAGLNAGDFTLTFRPTDLAGNISANFEDQGLLELIVEQNGSAVSLKSTDLLGVAGVYSINTALDVDVMFGSGGLALEVNGMLGSAQPGITNPFSLLTGDLFRLGGQQGIQVSDPSGGPGFITTNAAYSGQVRALTFVIPEPASAALLAVAALFIRRRR